MSTASKMVYVVKKWLGRNDTSETLVEQSDSTQQPGACICSRLAERLSKNGSDLEYRSRCHSDSCPMRNRSGGGAVQGIRQRSSSVSTRDSQLSLMKRRQDMKPQLPPRTRLLRRGDDYCDLDFCEADSKVDHFFSCTAGYEPVCCCDVCAAYVELLPPEALQHLNPLIAPYVVKTPAPLYKVSEQGTGCENLDDRVDYQDAKDVSSGSASALHHTATLAELQMVIFLLFILMFVFNDFQSLFLYYK